MGHLNKGINPSSLKNLDFDPKYISAPIQAGLVTAMIALAVSTNSCKNNMIHTSQGNGSYSDTNNDIEFGNYKTIHLFFILLQENYILSDTMRECH